MTINQSTTDNPHYVTPKEADMKKCAMKPNQFYCAGPKCMAWRWAQMLGWQEGRDELVTYSTTHGYCGMVRS